ncbi:plasmid mobilization protein [Limobrevibacterium gyesilva]|uniref:Conjugal transfer protein TraJ n=1 Tax=Limobrevibacterium gyesilva TaxID=2991712 RepID=A0AA41YPN3_9PROT|nr:hypothetical protein [Limobrevibacterium gyesilva]MCW3476242.1 hypothetical protein [Limobrevibacterium gyesilva]
MKGEPRDRQRTLRVVVSASERARIEQRAEMAGLSVSAFLRAAGLNQPLRSVLDHDAVRELATVNGDQGRLGGLLKLWLAERAGQGASETEIRRLLDRLGELQARLAEIAGRV